LSRTQKRNARNREKRRQLVQRFDSGPAMEATQQQQAQFKTKIKHAKHFVPTCCVVVHGVYAICSIRSEQGANTGRC
jgi:hypothetical protein